MDTLETKTVSRDVLVERARELVPLIRLRSDEAERNRRLSVDVVDAMRGAGLCRVMQPKRYGGFEYDFTTMARIIIEIGAACGSTAWVSGLFLTYPWLISQFPIETQDEIWGEEPEALACASFAATGQTRAVPGGYSITGKWRYASGCDDARWALLSVFLPPDREGGKPQPGFLMANNREYAIEDDWFTVGLAATGSKTLVCEDQFIPAHRRVTMADLTSGRAPGTAHHAYHLYKIPMMATLPAALALPALGILKGAIDDFIDSTGARQTRGAVVAGGFRMSDFPHVQGRVGDAAAALNAGTALILSDLAETERLSAAGEPITIDRRIRNRLSQAYIVKLAVQGVDALYAATGGAGLYSSNRLQRAWRDVHAVAHHVSFNWDAVSSMYGQHAFGLEPKGQY
jgi:alkylation response protein AidB-like acyl-CoA dehydrogenase